MHTRIRPTPSDERRALAFAGDLATCSTGEDLTEAVCTLPDLIGADSMFVAVDASVRRGEGDSLAVSGVTNDPGVYDRQVLEAMSVHWRQQPVVVRQLRSLVDRPEKISDHVSALEWRCRALYDQAYRHMGMEHELATHISWGRGRVECAALHRQARATDFGERDRDVLALVTPHIRAARDRIALLDEQRERIALLERMSATGGGSTLLERGTASAMARLTARQAEVAALLLEGHTGPQIAERLQITRRTADSHIEHIYRRLGAHNRAQAVAILLGRAGLDGVSA